MTYDPKRPATYTSTEREIDRTAAQAHDAADRAHEGIDQARDKAQDLTNQARDKAEELKGQAREQAQVAAERADEATTAAGARMTDAAQALRERAPESGAMADAAHKTADTLDRAGTYLQQRDMTGMRNDLENVIRQHPIESLLVGLGIGFLLARSTRR